VPVAPVPAPRADRPEVFPESRAGVPGSVAAIPITPLNPTGEDAVTLWLGLYHAAVSGGSTRGVVVDAYAELPGRTRGLVDHNNRLSLVRSAAVKRIVSRARQWGPMLRQAEANTLPGVQSYDDDVVVTLLTRGRRRLVLVWNTSTTRFLRTSVFLPEQVDGRPAERAVEVAGEPGMLGGAVYTKRRGKIDIKVDLAPGNAGLFELF
jgi:hypothetical protein